MPVSEWTVDRVPRDERTPLRFGVALALQHRSVFRRLAIAVCVALLSLCATTGAAQADPFSWSTPIAIAHNGPGRSTSIACPSVTQCTAVDNGGGEVTFDPTSTTPNSTARTVDAGQINLAVACPSAAQCTAVSETGSEVTFNPTAAAPNS